MAFKRSEWTKETTTTTGTGTITLAGARNPGRTFATAISNGDTFKYSISHQSLNEFETGTGTMVTSTTFSRSVITSSNANALVNFSAGTKNVDVVVDETDLNTFDRAATTSLKGQVVLATTTEALTGTDTAKALTADALAALWEKGTDNTGGATITLGDGYQHDLITSTTTITALAFTTDKAGRMALLRFATARSVTHSGTLISPTQANLLMNVGDALLVESLGGGTFRIFAVFRNDVVAGVPGVSSNTTVTTATALTTNISCGGVFTIKANTARVGSVYRLTGKYVYVHTAAALPTVTIEVVVNGVAVDSLVITPTSTAGTFSGSIEANVRYQALGSGTTGKIMVTIDQWNTYGSTFVNQAGGTTAGVSVAVPGGVQDDIDTTIDRTLELRIRMTTGVASNTLSCLQGFVEKVF